MKIYAVGGVIRDTLLNIKNKDCDYVVVGATPEKMAALGFRPIGQDFPVFLHPKTHAEYALARTERKTSAGYKGFQFYYAADVTLQEDLARRDLTINAMAREVDENNNLIGPIIDPFDGQADLAARVFRHIGPAFSEDPVRILRIARFAAHLTDFSIAPETLALMKKMVANGEVDALVPERIWQELARGIMEKEPSRLFEVLKSCGVLKRVLPEVDQLFGVPQNPIHHPEVDTGVHVMMVLDYAAKQGYSLPIRFAALTHDLGKGMTSAKMLPNHPGHEMRSVELLKPLCQRLKVPNECKDFALLAAREHGNIHNALKMDAVALIELLERCDAFRKPERFADVLKVCEADSRGRTHLEIMPYLQAEKMIAVLSAASSIDAGAIALQCSKEVEAIKKAIKQARVDAVKALENI